MLIVSLILLQVVIFGALIFILRRILTRNVILATRHLDELNQDYSKKDQDIQKRMDDLKQKSEEIVSKAHGDARELMENVIKEADAEKDKILNQARVKGEEMIKQADRSRQLLISEIEDRISRQAVNKACELIQDVLPGEFKRIVHMHWVEDLIKDGFSQLERVSIPIDIKEVVIKSAFELSEEERKALSRKIREALGHDIVLKEAVEPQMVAGVVISIGSLVLDGSFRNKIQEQAKKIQM